MSGNLRVTVAAGLATILASLSLLPAFRDGNHWLWPSVLTICLVAATGYGLRRFGVPRLLVPVAQLVALAWVLLLVCAPQGTRWGFLPSADSVQDFAYELELGLDVITRFAAPVPSGPEIGLATTVGVALVAVMTDTLAATLRLAPWAGLPLLLLYSVPATTIEGGLTALAFVPAAVGYLVLLVSDGRERLSGWGRSVTTPNEPGPGELAVSLFGRTGRRVGATVVCLAVVVPALLPALPEGILPDPGGGGGVGSENQRTLRVDNPMVDLRRDLRMPENFVVMNYTTSARNSDYIRLVTLDEFDGESWRPSSTGRPLPGDGRLTPPRGLDEAVPRTVETARFSISEGLRSEWLPLFYPTQQVDVPGEWGYTPSSLEVRARNNATSTAGIEYTASYLVPEHRGPDLRAAAAPPADIQERYTRLPDDLPSRVTDIADQLTANDQTDYDAAVSLQEWFRSEFTYSLQTVPGHSESHLIDFLNDRRGYCEQFAATMAIMARSLGIPARVAVGYQAGTPIGDSYEVRVQDAHAWPELYFAGHGWVRFEPTPVQQTGSPPEWTSIPDDEERPEPTPEPTTETAEPTPDPTTETADPEEQQEPDPAAAGGGDSSPLNPAPFLIGAGVLLVLVLPGVARVLVRRSRLGRSPGDRAEACWRELQDSARDLGITWPGGSTPRGAAAKLAERLPVQAHQALWSLVNEVERGRYAPQPGPPAAATDATRHLLAALTASATGPWRILAVVFPLTVLTWLAAVPRVIGSPFLAAERFFTRLFSRPRSTPEQRGTREGQPSSG